MQVTNEELIEGLLDLQVGDEFLVKAAVHMAQDQDRVLSTVLTSKGVPANQAVDAICAIYGLPRVPPELLRKAHVDLIDPAWEKETFWRLRAIPFYRRGRHLWIAFCDAHFATGDTTFGLPEHRAFLTHERLVTDALHRILGPTRSMDTVLGNDPAISEPASGLDISLGSMDGPPTNPAPTPFADSRAPTRKVVLDSEDDPAPTMEESALPDRHRGTDYSRLPATMEEVDDEENLI
jgi:hypothetical protein